MLSRLLPPIVLDGLRRLRRRAEYADYAAAARACQGQGYEEKTLLAVIRRKTDLYRAGLAGDEPARLSLGELQLLSLLCPHESGRPIRILDVGGACGAHYFTIRAVLRHAPIRFCWQVVETPGLVNAARGLENDEVSFHPSLADALLVPGKIDVAFSSGTLQCVPQPYQMLEDLLRCRADYVVLARLGLHTGVDDVIVTHDSRLSMNGPGPLPAEFADAPCRYPFTFPSRLRVDRLLAEKYRIMAEVADPSGVFPVNDRPLVGLGYLAAAR